MKNFQFIFFRLSLYLVAGILLGFYIELDQADILYIGLVILLFYVFTHYRSRKILFKDALPGISSFLLIFYLGFFTAYYAQPKNDPDHYIQQNLDETDSALILGRITEELKPSAFANRYILEAEGLIDEDITRPFRGKILVTLISDTIKKFTLVPGDKILIPFELKEINGSLNPFQFNYRDYMQSLQVEKQVNLVPSRLSIVGKKSDLRSASWKFREKLIANLDQLKFGPDEIGVFQALILGQKRDISEQLYKNYAAAGAIHILAISGLHVGILLLLLNFLLKPLEKVKLGRFIKPVTLILMLWSFAFITGLSPSVVRAVCMFSFLAVGMQLRRKTSSMNSLFLSLFFLLLLNPYYLFQVGFQLSYLAVFSIIIFQPVIYNLFTPKLKLIDYFWKLTSVSLAAQFGVLPLSIFYFHQFPGLFLISNLVVLPFLGLILILGILVIILSSFNILPGLIESIFQLILHTLNQFINRIADLDTFVLSDIKLSAVQCLALYLLIISIIRLTQRTDFASFSFTLSCVLLFQFTTIYTNLKVPEYESVIFHRSKNSVFTVKNKNELTLYSNYELDSVLLKDYLRERDIEKLNKIQIPKILDLSGNITLVIDTSGNYQLNDFKPELLILRNSPKINLERLLDHYMPQQVIADGSNYKTFINRWKATAENKKLPFHYTGEKGAYIIK